MTFLHAVAVFLTTLGLAAYAQEQTRTPTSSPGQGRTIDSHVQADIGRHKAMAAAHEAAAQCLAAGKEHALCQKELAQACKGLALGKSCGMRHAH